MNVKHKRRDDVIRSYSTYIYTHKIMIKLHLLVYIESTKIYHYIPYFDIPASFYANGKRGCDRFLV